MFEFALNPKKLIIFLDFFLVSINLGITFPFLYDEIIYLLLFLVAVLFNIFSLSLFLFSGSFGLDKIKIPGFLLDVEFLFEVLPNANFRF